VENNLKKSKRLYIFANVQSILFYENIIEDIVGFFNISKNKRGLIDNKYCEGKVKSV